MKKYFVRTRLIYNTFGADEHILVELLHGDEIQNNVVQSHKWSTYLFPNNARRRSERKIKHLVSVYSARVL